MRAVRVILVLVLAAVLSGAMTAPAMAARPLATPQFTSAVVVDSRTVTLSWTPVKGADHYVVEYAPGMRVYTTDTSVTITDLYPGTATTSRFAPRRAATCPRPPAIRSSSRPRRRVR